ncbi:hypothetical protein [Varibaculum cambriense]|uniref:hypothetical protein n=1 Tax=Varibaculum cambriense TaxID=184870 RepID=UPI0028FE9CD5|nr:hypothetical protein [Varibaculum cambriense]MDU1225129.1 hypothetical protein [Varibaculum cambriense]
MSILNIALLTAAMILAAAGVALIILATQERIRLRLNPPRHLKPEPTTSKENSND